MSSYLVCSKLDHYLWLHHRRQGFTASEIPAICGVDRHKTLSAVILEKLDPKGIDDNFHMLRGRLAEDYVFHKLAREIGQKADQNNGLYGNTDIPYLYATPDYIGDDFVVEVKAPQRFPKDVPLKYEYQLTVQMMVCDKPRGILMIGSIDENRYQAYEYKHNNNTQKKILECLDKAVVELKKVEFLNEHDTK